MGVGNVTVDFLSKLVNMMNKLDNLKCCRLERVVFFDVLYKNMVIDKHNSMYLKEEIFDTMMDWDCDVDIKYRSGQAFDTSLRIPESSDLILSKKISMPS